MDAYVGRGEADQRGRLLVEPDGARLPLLVATAAHGVQLVGGQKSGMVQAFFSRILSGRRNHRAVFYLGAATSTSHRRWIDHFSSIRVSLHWQILLFHSSDDCVVFVFIL